MEFLVRKASLSIFLQDQLKKQTERIGDLVKGSKELQGLVVEYTDTLKKLNALNEEIEEDPNVKVLREIIFMAKAKKDSYESDPLLFFARRVGEVAELLLGRIVK